MLATSAPRHLQKIKYSWAGIVPSALAPLVRIIAVSLLSYVVDVRPDDTFPFVNVGPTQARPSPTKMGMESSVTASHLISGDGVGVYSSTLGVPLRRSPLNSLQQGPSAI